ncbi:MAG: Holliday junction resolvase RuvX [Erysipelotrichaceae bacterium]|nr:Holliday junction resolvase RuvX [Erysipelotrichaceae bacterium]
MGKVLGLDLGEKSLGIAISDLMGIIATGVENFRFESMDFDKAMERVKFYVKRDNIKEIALGLPLHMSGDESDHSLMCRDFKARIEKEIPGVKVALVDERWTTKQANRYLLEADLSRNKRKKVIDKMAAVCILEAYLPTRK